MAVRVGVVLSAAMAVAGCSEDEKPDYTEICVDSRIMERVEDERCGDRLSGDPSVLWYYVGSPMAAPPVGGKVGFGSFTKPASGTIGRAPSSGGFGTFMGSTGS